MAPKPSLKDMEGFAIERTGKEVPKPKKGPVKKKPAPKKVKAKEIRMGRPKVHEYAADKKITAYIPEGIHKALRMKAADDNKPMVYHICSALEKYLKV